MDRLTDLLAGPGGRVAVVLEFDVDRQGIRHIGGRLQAEVQMRCQRCLQPMDVVIDQPIRLGLAVGEVEDELLLALPIAPIHPQAHCPAAGDAPGRDDQEPGQDEERPNPFRALADWKRQSD